MRDVGEVTGDDARHDRPRGRTRESALERHLLAGKKKEACLGEERREVNATAPLHKNENTRNNCKSKAQYQLLGAVLALTIREREAVFKRPAEGEALTSKRVGGGSKRRRVWPPPTRRQRDKTATKGRQITRTYTHKNLLSLFRLH